MSFKSRMTKFLAGRYGADELYNTLFICQIVCLFLGAFLSILGKIHSTFTIIAILLYFLGVILFVWTLFRCFSRNILARRKENQAFLQLCKNLRHPFRSAKQKNAQDTATHIFRACPHCGANLRLPREVGRHTVKCPRCAQHFNVKVKKYKAK